MPRILPESFKRSVIFVSSGDCAGSPAGCYVELRIKDDCVGPGFRRIESGLPSRRPRGDEPGSWSVCPVPPLHNTTLGSSHPGGERETPRPAPEIGLGTPQRLALNFVAILPFRWERGSYDNGHTLLEFSSVLRFSYWGFISPVRRKGAPFLLAAEINPVRRLPMSV